MATDDPDAAAAAAAVKPEATDAASGDAGDAGKAAGDADAAKASDTAAKASDTSAKTDTTAAATGAKASEASDGESGKADKPVRAPDKAADAESGKADKSVRAPDKAADAESGKADKPVRAPDKAADAESGKADKSVRAPDKAAKAELPDTSEGLAAKLNRKKWLVFIIVGLLSLVADQATKIWARGTLPTDRIHASLNPSVTPLPCVIPDDIVSRACQGHEVGVIGKFWSWRLSMNPGSAFGLFSGQNSARIFLSIVGIAAVFGMVWMLRKARTDQKVLHWALALVAGGAIGNLIDRIYYGVVTDFVLWRYDTHEWPVFNVADIVLVIGVGLMFIDIQKEGKREKRERAEKVKAAGLVKRR